MNAAEKELVKALRSGDYNQGTHWLRSNGNFCCLGVACDVLDPSGWTVPSFQTPDIKVKAFYDNHTKSLPESVRLHYGWSSMEGKTNIYSRRGIRQSLIHLNDDGLTFDQIADIIEAGLVTHIGEVPPPYVQS